MNIPEMSDPDKSVMLARLCGWEFSQQQYGEGRWSWVDGNGMEISGSLHPAVVEVAENPSVAVAPMLYSPARMALAWYVLGWGMNHDAIKGDLIYVWLSWEIYDMRPADAARAWLDKILELAIAAGLVEVDEMDAIDSALQAAGGGES